MRTACASLCIEYVTCREAHQIFCELLLKEGTLSDPDKDPIAVVKTVDLAIRTVNKKKKRVHVQQQWDMFPMQQEIRSL